MKYAGAKCGVGKYAVQATDSVGPGGGLTGGFLVFVAYGAAAAETAVACVYLWAVVNSSVCSFVKCHIWCVQHVLWHLNDERAVKCDTARVPSCVGITGNSRYSAVSTGASAQCYCVCSILGCPRNTGYSGGPTLRSHSASRKYRPYGPTGLNVVFPL